jgi:hypothetical protein
VLKELRTMKLLKLVPDNTNIKFLRWRVPFYVDQPAADGSRRGGWS